MKDDMEINMRYIFICSDDMSLVLADQPFLCSSFTHPPSFAPPAEAGGKSDVAATRLVNRKNCKH